MRLKCAGIAAALLLTLTVIAPSPRAAPNAAAKAQVFVVATLYKRHESVPAYDLATLRKVIQAIKPEVLVLDVTPDELKNEKVWPGKIEYPGVVFPLMKELKVRAYGSEPAEPLFGELSQAAGTAYRQLEQMHPQAFQTMKRHEQATYEGLKTVWRSPADVNSTVTDTIIAGKRALEERLVGETATSAQQRWNEHHAERVLDAARQNPGKRILFLVGIENRYAVVNQLRQNPHINLVEMESWLRANYPLRE